MLIKNLFKIRRRRNYNIRKNILDNRKNLGNDYRENMLKNSMSAYIYRNAHMNDFTTFLQQILADVTDTIACLKIYKSYTMKKDDTKVR